LEDRSVLDEKSGSGRLAAPPRPSGCKETGFYCFRRKTRSRSVEPESAVPFQSSDLLVIGDGLRALTGDPGEVDGYGIERIGETTGPHYQRAGPDELKCYLLGIHVLAPRRVVKG
jgi:hypothetical protein